MIARQYKDDEVLYKEIVSGGKHGDYITCPMLLMDPYMPLSWDFQHSSIFNMNLIIKKDPKQVKERWNILFAAHIFDYDYSNIDFIQLFEYIVKWVKEYPETLILSEGNETERNTVVMNSSFLS